MTMAMYLEHYMCSAQSLPSQLKRNFNLMHDLDVRIQKLMKRIDQRCDTYLSNIKLLSPQNNRIQVKRIHSLFNKAKQYGDNKVQLAIESYQLVDKLIGRMDADLKKFHAYISVHYKEQKQAKKEQRRNMKRVAQSNDEDYDAESANKKKQKKKSGAKAVSAKGSSTSEVHFEVVYFPPLAGNSNPSDTLDMAVDPNESIYCFCHQVSYGDMICCDNPNCTIEWFHFPCVGLTTKPIGKWYCPKCTVKRKSKERFCPNCAVKRM